MKQNKELLKEAREDKFTQNLTAMVENQNRRNSIEEEKKRLEDSLRQLRELYNLNLEMVHTLKDQLVSLQNAKSDFDESVSKVAGIADDINKAVENAKNTKLVVEVKNKPSEDMKAQAAEPKTEKPITDLPKGKNRQPSLIKRFFGMIKKGIIAFCNGILRKPKPPKNPEPLRNPTKKPVELRHIDKWLDPTKKLWKRLLWRLYDDICESFWKFFAYEIAIIATTFAVLSYFYIIPCIMRWL